MQVLKSFKMKALLFMIPALVGMSSVFTFVSIYSEKEITRNEIVKRAETITTLATKTGELPILSGNPELLQGTVAFLRANSEVSSVTFYDKEMTQLIHDGLPVFDPQPVIRPEQPISMIDATDSFVFYAPVFTERTQEESDILQESPNVKKVKEIIGWIRLGFSKSAMRENERRIVLHGLILAIIFTTGSCIFVYFLISAATRPLAQIVKVADNISHGDFSREIQIDHDDEIGALARAFSSMKKTIQQVLGETDALIAAVQEGRIDSRSDARVFEGEWRNLVDGVNNLTDSFAKVHEELQIAKESAESASRAKSDFLSSMSHELRTPLNAIMGYAQILKRQDNLTNTQQQQLEIMRSSGEHLLMLINDILDVSKIEARKMELTDAPFDLAALMRQVYNLTRLQAEEKNLHFHHETVTPLPDYVRGDERKLRQILLNLLSNAVKYTRRGSIRLQVSYGQAGPGQFRCEVKDTGAGIPPDKLDTVFEPFTQLLSNRQVREGTGLGLNITKQLTEMMKGRVGVESGVGEGSLFWVEVPLAVVAEEDVAKPIRIDQMLDKIDTQQEIKWNTVAPDTTPARAREDGDAGEEPVVAPPLEDLKELYDLAMRGDLERIHVWAETLKEQAMQYARFSGILIALAGGFKVSDILALVEQHMKEKE